MTELTPALARDLVVFALALAVRLLVRNRDPIAVANARMQAIDCLGMRPCDSNNCAGGDDNPPRGPRKPARDRLGR